MKAANTPAPFAAPIFLEDAKAAYIARVQYAQSLLREKRNKNLNKALALNVFKEAKMMAAFIANHFGMPLHEVEDLVLWNE